MAEDPTTDTTAAPHRAIRDAHRAASAQLSEGPDPGVRAAVLAAAARAVDARPHDAARRAVRSPFRARPWPLSAAAVLVVSVMTGLIATRAMRDDPDRLTSSARSTAEVTANESAPAAMNEAAPAAPTVDIAAPPPRVAPARPLVGATPYTKTDDRALATAGLSAVRPPSPHPSSAVASPDAHAARQAVATDAMRKVRPDDEVRRGASADSRPFREAEPAVRQERASPKPFPDPFVATPAPAGTPPVAARSALSRDATVEGPQRPQQAPPAAPAASPPPAPAPASDARSDKQAAASINNAQRLRRGAEPLTPQAWVDRIVGLRQAGEAEAADREVEALHARYPDFEIPPAALRPAGTR